MTTDDRDAGAIPLVLPLDAATDPYYAGNKAVHLRRLSAEGFAVPSAFVLTTEAYRHMLAQPALADHAAAVMGAPSTRLRPACRAFREQLQRVGVEARLFAELDHVRRALLEETGTGLDDGLAVRSSATDEDGPRHSFAGQLHSELGVRTLDQLCAAVISCWAGLFSPRVELYRRQRPHSDPPRLALLIQRLVAAESAGVLFTAEPITGARDHLVVEATWGLGAALVDGRISPDRWVLDRANGRTITSEVGSKASRLIATSDGVALASTEPTQRAAVSLGPDDLLRLLRLGVAIEDRFGCPQDIEWAFAAGELFVLQARPLGGFAPPS